jgi:hypothetical protein
MKTLLLLTAMLSACTSTLPELKYPDGHTRVPVNPRKIAAVVAADPAQDTRLPSAAAPSWPGPER